MNDAQPEAADGIDIPSAPPTATLAESHLNGGRLWLSMMLLALVACVVSTVATERFHLHVIPPSFRSSGMGNPIVIRPADQVKADRQNAMIVFAIQGGVIALSLGLAAGLAQGGPRRAIAGAIVGGIAGALAGLAGSYVLHLIYFQQMSASEDQLSQDVFFPMLIRSGLYALIGKAAGIAVLFGLGATLSRATKAIPGAIMGGILGAVVFELVGALTFPADRTYQPISESLPSRAFAACCLCLFVALLTLVFLTSKERPKIARPST